LNLGAKSSLTLENFFEYRQGLLIEQYDQHLKAIQNFKQKISSTPQLPSSPELFAQCQNLLDSVHQQEQQLEQGTNGVNHELHIQFFDPLHVQHFYSEVNSKPNYQHLSDQDKIATVLAEALRVASKQGVEEMEMRLNVMQTELDHQTKETSSLCDQVNRWTSNMSLMLAREPQLQSKVEQLTLGMERLEAKAAVKQRRRDEINKIKSQPQLKAFYLRVIQKLNQILLAASVVSSGMVDHAPDAMETLVGFLGSLGGEAGIPGVGIATQIAAGFVNWVYGKHRNTRIARMADLAESLSSMTNIVEKLARSLVYRYEEQITWTTGEGPKLAAESAVKRVLAMVKDGEVRLSNDSDEEASMVILQLLRGIRTKRLPFELSNLSNAVMKANQIPTKLNDKWDETKLFTKPGIKVLQGADTNKPSYAFYHPKDSDAECYFYVLGDSEEVNTLHLMAEASKRKHQDAEGNKLLIVILGTLRAALTELSLYLEVKSQPTAVIQHILATDKEMKDMKKRLNQIEAHHPTTAPVSSSSDAGDELIEKLAKLGNLKEKGLLSEEEFTAAKKKLLMG